MLHVAPRVKGSDRKRLYDNERRKARSDETRNRILAVARELMTAHGYRATTIAAVARGAQVHADTIYELVGRKPAMLRELIERAISGEDREVRVDARDYVLEMRDELDPATKLAIYAAAATRIQQRMAPLLLALRDAAATDDDARAVWEEINDRRARNMTDLVRDLGPSGTLRHGISVEQAADTIWLTAGAETFIQLTIDRGWSAVDFEGWLTDVWVRSLLQP